MSYDRPRRLSLEQITLALVATGGVTLWALLAPELGGHLDLGRTNLTIWATTFLLLPALAFYLFRTAGQGAANLSHLFWTGAWAIFIVHAYWAVYIIFDGILDTIRQMGIPISAGNFLLTVLWTVDVVILWLPPLARRVPIRVQHLIRFIAFLIFALTLVGLRGGPVQVLGFVFVGVLALAVLLRLLVHTAPASKELAP